MLKYEKCNRLLDQRKQIMISDGQTMNQLLWQTCLEYKTKEEYKGFSWGSIRKKYKNIREVLAENYPTDEVDKEKYPNGEKVGEVKIA